MTYIAWIYIILAIPALVATWFFGYILGMQKADKEWCGYLKIPYSWWKR